MRTPGDTSETSLTFPVTAARTLAARLDRVASALDEATGARAQAGAALTEFQGAYADHYRETLDDHARSVAGLVERLRRTAGRLRDAIDEYEDLRRRAAGVAA
ncbi:MAG TPA: hypothetical protein VIL48_08645 [Acidimicrobiales bacterium]